MWLAVTTQCINADAWVEVMLPWGKEHLRARRGQRSPKRSGSPSQHNHVWGLRWLVMGECMALVVLDWRCERLGKLGADE